MEPQIGPFISFRSSQGKLEPKHLAISGAIQMHDYFPNFGWNLFTPVFSQPPHLHETFAISSPYSHVLDWLHGTSPQGVPLQTGGVSSIVTAGLLLQTHSPMVVVFMLKDAPETQV